MHSDIYWNISYAINIVPVIVIFTKFDAHDDDAYEALMNEGISPNEAVNQAQSRAMEDFQKTCMSLPIFTCRYPPKTYIILRGMALIVS